ncbi:MAG: hypothetical protein J2P19_06625 [Pseudonocardia sp.]|nr:hypothetical protein [Pseudonocardia sp.]
MSCARDRHDDPVRWSAAHAAYEISRQERDWQAVRVVAGHATDIEDCAELLAMLGLDARAVRAPRQAR